MERDMAMVYTLMQTAIRTRGNGVKAADKDLESTSIKI